MALVLAEFEFFFFFGGGGGGTKSLWSAQEREGWIEEVGRGTHTWVV